MGLNNFVGGRNFTLGKFSKNLGTVSQYGALKNFKAPILKIVKSRLAAIQGGRFKSAEAMHRLSSDQKPTFAEKKAISAVLKRLENTPTRATESVSRKDIIDRALKNENTEEKQNTGMRVMAGEKSSDKEKKSADEKAAEVKLVAKEKAADRESKATGDRPFKAPLNVRINRAHSGFNKDLSDLDPKQANRIMARVSTAQNRLKNMSGVSGPASQTPPGGSTPPAPVERISFN